MQLGKARGASADSCFVMAQGKYARAYRNFIKIQSDMMRILKKRKTAIEPIFDLISQLLGTSGNTEATFPTGHRKCPNSPRFRRVISANCDDC